MVIGIISENNIHETIYMYSENCVCTFKDSSLNMFLFHMNISIETTKQLTTEKDIGRCTVYTFIMSREWMFLDSSFIISNEKHDTKDQ